MKKIAIIALFVTFGGLTAANACTYSNGVSQPKNDAAKGAAKEETKTENGNAQVLNGTKQP